MPKPTKIPTTDPNVAFQNKMQTAETSQGAGGPTLMGTGFGTGSKYAFAPSLDDAESFLNDLPDVKSGKLKVLKKVNSNNKDIFDSPDDLYVIDKEVYDKIQGIEGLLPQQHNAVLDALGTKASPGIIGGIAHTAIPMAGGYLGGTGAGALTSAVTANPIAGIAGASVGAGAGQALGGMANQRVGEYLYDKKPQPIDNTNVMKDFAIGALTEGALRSLPVVAPEVGYPTGKLADKLAQRLSAKGESVAKSKGYVSELPVGTEKINVNKLTTGHEVLRKAEASKMNEQISGALKKAEEDINNAEEFMSTPQGEGAGMRDLIGPSGAGAKDPMSAEEFVTLIKETMPREYGNHPDADILKIWDDANTYKKFLRNLKTAFTNGRESGFSPEDYVNMKPNQLMRLKSLVLKRADVGVDAPELAEIVPQLGDVSASASGIKKPPVKPSAKSIAYSPMNYAARGAEAYAKSPIAYSVLNPIVEHGAINPFLPTDYPKKSTANKVTPAAMIKSLKGKK